MVKNIKNGWERRNIEARFGKRKGGLGIGSDGGLEESEGRFGVRFGGDINVCGPGSQECGRWGGDDECWTSVSCHDHFKRH